MLFAIYNYAWGVPSSLRALARIALRREGWVKTPRTAVGASVLTGQAPRLAGDAT
jgi:hypothetical protein